jgi:putative solute:sodium symporter small subunit
MLGGSLPWQTTVFMERKPYIFGGGLMADKSDNSGHWEATKSLLWKTLAVWVFFSFIVHWFGSALNSESFPGSYFMAGQGAQLAFVLLIFWFVKKQGQIDDDHGVSE